MAKIKRTDNNNGQKKKDRQKQWPKKKGQKIKKTNKKKEKNMYLPYTPFDKYVYKRKQNITIDEDKHQLLLIIML
jgi:hypothetical protein